MLSMPKKSTKSTTTKTAKGKAAAKTPVQKFVKGPAKQTVAAKAKKPNKAEAELDAAANKPVQLEVKGLVGVILVGALAVLIFGGWLWWHYIYQNPERVFWGALEQSMSTPGVTKRTEQASEAGKLDQTTQLALGSQNYAHTLTTLSQPGPNKQQQSVTTETLGTLSAQYVRYSNVKTGTRADGKKPDLSKVENIWGKADVDAKASKSTNRMLSEALIGTVPVGNLTHPQRQELMNLARNKKVYDTDFTVKNQREQGHKVYVYSVKVQPEAYVSMLRIFAKQVGLGDLAELDPANYKGVPAVPVEFSVDPITRQIIKVAFKDGSGRNETYSSYGALPNITPPAQTIPLRELQARTQQI
jgi:hypothetical protein